MTPVELPIPVITSWAFVTRINPNQFVYIPKRNYIRDSTRFGAMKVNEVFDSRLTLSFFVLCAVQFTSMLGIKTDIVG